jgi:hypothetical protein
MDLPTAGPGPLLRPRLRAAGMSEGELRRLRRRGELTPLVPGAYVTPDDMRLGRPEARHALLVAAAVPRVAADAVVSHASAAVMWGLPTWNTGLDRVHVTRPRRSGGLRTGRLHGHTAPLDPDEIRSVGGVAVTSAARTLADIARTERFEQAVVIVDAALHRHLVTRDDLLTALERMSRWPGVPAARRVIAFADARAESPGESRSRVAMARLGLPAPILQWEVVRADGVTLGRVDFAWPEYGRVGEFDGYVKYGRLLRPGQVPADVVYEEKRREDAIRAEDLGMTRWTWPEIDTFTGVARKLFPR